MTKKCSTCQRVRDLREYYKRGDRNGEYRSACKSCTKERISTARMADPDRFRRWSRTANIKHRVSMRAHQRLLTKTPRYRLYSRAKAAVKAALRKGTLTRQTCRFCSNPTTEAHHSDYTRYLHVDWLCEKHHAAWHRLFVPHYGEELPVHGKWQTERIRA